MEQRILRRRNSLCEDANGQSLTYVYSRETTDAANIAGVLTEDEARRIASNIAKPPSLLSYPMTFEIIGEISDIETIATGKGIREIARLREAYPSGRNWRKRKGVAHIRLPNGSVRLAELHWYEAHGIGPQEYKIKHLL
jgi:hypothetical protein